MDQPSRHGRRRSDTCSYGTGVAVIADADTYLIEGTAEANSLVAAYIDANNNNQVDDGETVAGQQQLNSGATNFFLSVTLTQDAENNFVVVVTDAAGNESSATDVPTITEDSTPTDMDLFPGRVDENLPAGALVGSLSTVDVTPGDRFTYALVVGDGDDDNASFEIVGDELRTKAAFDFETKSALFVCVRTTDEAGLWYEESFTISITNVNDAPSVNLANTVTTLPENTPTTPRIEVADIVVTDDELGTNVLSLSGTDAGLFEIDGTMLCLKAGTVLDYEANPQLDVTVEVNDASVGTDPDGTAALSIGVTAVPDIVMQSIAADGLITLSVTYTITGAAVAGFDIGFYRSAGATYEVTDSLLGTVRIDATARLDARATYERVHDRKRCGPGAAAGRGS